ncbi:MAG: 50S ribosomal protein L24 [Clostridiales Family XIII bacterium]|jgi:large subunit ribosomal protein L24|nr:50S ribosomal protein L24 [Clostridiales Family XIII bacterium]
MHIKKEDTVVVITGKDKGKRGKVLKVFKETGRILVEGVNVQTKHQKQTRKERSDIKHIEGPIDASNVMYYDTKAKSGTRVGHRIEDGEKVRYSKKSGQTID